MKKITQTQILQWKAELNSHKEKLYQAQAVLEQETKLIQMIEGGIQFGETLLKKSESEDQASHKEEKDLQSGKAQLNS
tara:strand:+ start:28170 stop:28403 length:234 start_codon:yes stop_codon:yes gene_type:complete